MLTCITCSKQRSEDGGGGEEEAARGTPKDSVKSLTSQIKDMALKVSGKQSKPSTPSSHRRGQRQYPDFDTITEGVPYPYRQPGAAGSSSLPTAAWDFTSSSSLHPRHHGYGGGDRTPGKISISAQSDVVVVEDDDEPKEWTAQVEPGIQITFVSLPQGGNDLKRIRFSRDMYNKWEAQRWWGENYDRIMELYNVQRFNKQALDTPARSEAGRDSSYSRLGSARDSPMMTPSAGRSYYRHPSGSQGYFPSSDYHDKEDGGKHYNAGGGGGAYGQGAMSSMEASRTTTDSRDEASVSISNASEVESEWVEEDEPGVYITIRQLMDGTRELRRVRFSREKFGEVNAKQWWETNRERIQAQYL